MYTSGENTYGQLGTKDEIDRDEFVKVNLKGRRVALISGGTHFTVAALTEPAMNPAHI